MSVTNDQSAGLNDKVLLAIFEKSNGSLIIKANPPHFTILAASDQLLQIALVKREDIIGKDIFEVFPDNPTNPGDVQQARDAFLKVIATRQQVDLPVYSYDLYVPATGRQETFYWSTINVPIAGEDGKVQYILNTTTNITDEILLKKKKEVLQRNIEIRQRRMDDVFMRAPVGIAFLEGEDFIIQYANEVICEMWDNGRPGEVAGKPVFEVAAAAADEFKALLTNVVKTGVPFSGKNVPVPLKRNSVVQTFYFDLVFEPMRDAGEQITGLIGMCIEVTEYVKATKVLIDSETKFRNLIMRAPVAISVLRGYDLIIESANDLILQLWGKEPGITGMRLEDALPELKGQPYIPFLQQVYKSGIPKYGSEARVVLHRNGRDETAYFNFVYEPIAESGRVTGIMVVATEVTSQVETKHALQESERQFRNLVIQSPVGMGVLRGKDLIIELYNQELLNIWGRKAEDVDCRRLMEVFPELEGQQFPALLANVLETGQVYSEREAVVYIRSGTELIKYYVDFTYDALRNTDDAITGIMVTVVNVTEQVKARHKLEDAEERLRLATGATGVATFDLDLNTRDIIHSPRLAEIFINDASVRISHLQMRKIIHADDIPMVEKAFDLAMKTGRYFYEARVIWPDNTTRWIRTQGKVIFAEDNTPMRMLGTLMDITEQRRVLDELKESEENLRLANTAAELGTFDWNIKTNSVSWDKRGRELFGIVSDADINYNEAFPQALHADDWQKTRTALSKAMNKDESDGEFDVEYRTIGIEDKKRRWVRAKGKVFFDSQGEPQRLIGSLLDITENKLDEIRKNDFIAMASHELKTPLTSLKAYIQMLLTKAKKSDDQFLTNALQKSDNQITRMTKLIYSFLDLSKIEAGKLQLSKQQFDINELIDEVIVETRLISPGHTILFEQEKAIAVNADREKIGQVMLNLVNNAIKYSPKGTSVKVNSFVKDDTVKVQVTDDGIGIKPEDQEHIFQRFYRVEDDSTRGSSGFGIGLYLAAEIIDLHHGNIGVTSREGKGSTFYFTIPLA